MNKKRLILVLVIGTLAISSVYFGIKASFLSKELAVSQADVSSVHKNEKIINFTRLFVEKVLDTDKEVDFETRLQLESAARDLRDIEVLAEWQKFTSSKTEAEAQREVKNLLRLLVNKAIDP